ncbi:MAG: DMT family transporter [Rhodospirillales bacterium]|nr:DMT family transporter [Rhodospirillales bacterium]MDP6884268.1 DMT family transporter [Rhodospirillales bacterium]
MVQLKTPRVGSNTLIGMAFMLGNALGATGVNAIVRGLSSDLHPFEMAFFRCVFGLIVLAPLIFRHGIEPFKTQRLGLHALRGVLQGAVLLMFFLALSMIPMATVQALFFTSPLFATLLALVVLGETIRARRITALVVGFGGVLVVLRPGFGALEPGALLMLAAAATWGSAIIVIKILSRTESSLTATLYPTLFVTPIALVAALPYWRWPTVDELGWMALLGTFATLSHLSLAQAFKEADVTAIMPVDFTKLIWAALAGYLLFAEVPGLSIWLGGTMIFSAVTYIAIRERSLKADPTLPREMT